MGARHVAVLGAGLVGACSALELLRRGFRVTLVDPAEPGGEQAASYGNAGWLSSQSIIPPSFPGVWKQVPGYLRDPLGPLAIRWSYLPRALPWLLGYIAAGSTVPKIEQTAAALRTLLKDSASMHQGLAREAGVAALIEQGGLLHVYRSREDYAKDGLGWRIRRAQGIALHEVDTEELRAREPDLHERYRFAIDVPEAGRCRNLGAYVAALVRLACARGADLRREEARGFRLRDGRLVAVKTSGGELACDGAVVCAGARSRALAAAAGNRVPLDSERGYHVTLEGAAVGPRTSMMAMDCKMVVNAMDVGLRAAGQVEIAGVDAPPNWARAEVLRRHLQSMFPALPREFPAERVRRWLGHRPSMPDGRPCLGHARATRDIVHAFGHGHVGVGAAPRTGRLVAQLLSGEPTEVPLSPFEPGRFA